MIPRIIHYCWFGRGKMPRLMKKCIKSWKKYCPDYQIIEWNEDNFDVNSTVWTKEAYESKKYAFVADYVRLKVLYDYGGIYLDTDQELVGSLDQFLEYDGFMGFACLFDLSCGVIGAVKEQQDIKELLNYYNGLHFRKEKESNQTPNTNIATEVFVKKGMKLNNSFQIISKTAIFPQTYFCPTHVDDVSNCISEETVAIHHWAMTWRETEEIKKMRRAKRRSSKLYQKAVDLRYLPNRIVRSFFGNDKIDRLKRKIGKG